MNELSITIPQNVENLQLPSPELLTFYKNLDERILWLDTDVDDYWLEFERHIIKWNAEDIDTPIEQRKPIRLMIFSYGGCLDINNSLVDIIKLSKTPIYGYNMGTAASAGCFIYLACHKRYCLPSSQFLIHKGSGRFEGTYDEIMCQITNYARQIEELADYILKNTKIPEDVLDEHLGTEWYLSAQDALELGVCDCIIKDFDEIVRGK